MLQSRRVEVAEHYDRGPEQARSGGRGKAHRPRPGDIHRRSGLNACIDRSVETGRQNVGQHRQIENLGLGLLFVGEAEQVEIGVGDHDVFRLAAHPTPEIDIAVGAAGPLVIDVEAHIRAPLPTRPAATASYVERHRNKISYVQVLYVRPALDDFACDLVSQHHTGRCAGPTAYHMLVGPADVSGEYLQDHTMRYL